MRTVILGGNGFIGINFAQHLSKNLDNEIVILARRAKSLNFPTIQNCTYVQGDCTDPRTISSVVKDGDKVVFLAYNSIPKTSFENPLKDINENLAGAVELFTTLKDKKISKLLYVSSGGTVYGKTEAYPIPEDHSCNPISPYGITKLTIEKYAHFFAEVYNLPVIIARPSNPFGAFQNVNSGQGFIATTIHAALQRGQINIYGNQGTVRDYIFIDDLVRAFDTLLASSYQKAEVFNIGTSIGYNNKQIVDLINQIAVKDGYYCNVSYLPERVFDVPYNVLNNDKLKKIGWNLCYNLNESLNETWNWYLKHQHD